MSYIIESKLDGEESPKKILNEFIDAFQKELAMTDNWERIFGTLLQGFHKKDLLMYSRDAEVQKVFDEFDLSGRVVKTDADQDYLNVITVSVGGNKSDQFIKQSLGHYSLIQRDGSIINELAITRHHTWTEKDLERWDKILADFGFSDLPEHIQNILGRGKNKSYIKIYVPKDSILIDAAGMDASNVAVRYDEEIDKTYFMFEMEVEAGTKKTVSVSYKLPRKLSLFPADSYRFFAQSQPGQTPSYFEKKIFFKPGIESKGQFPASFKKHDNGHTYYIGKLAGDLYLSSLVVK